MTVTSIERSGVQNPAYRPVAPLSFDSTMRLTQVIGALGGMLITACASVQPVAVPAPTTIPASTPAEPPPATAAAPAPPVKSAPRTGSWSFSYAPGTYTYTVVTDATIAPVSDTTNVRTIPEATQSATVAISATGDVQVIKPVVVTSAYCDQDASLTTRAAQLIPRIPSQLTVGDRWRDSTTTSGCRGMIPAESTVISNYLVIGDTTFGGIHTLQIHRADSLTASGSGADGQHRILLSAKGTGDSNIFLDIATGRFLGITGKQTSVVNINTSGRSTLFLQHVSESVSLAQAQ